MNKANQIKYISEQLFGQGNLTIVEFGFSEDYIAHAGEKTYKGQEFIRQYVKQLRKAMPDIKLIRIEILAQTEDTLSWQRIFSGIHSSGLNGIPASNKKVKWHEIVVSRFEKDVIVEEWISSDLAFQMMLKLKK